MVSEKTLGSTSENHNAGYFTFPVSYNSEELFSSIQQIKDYFEDLCQKERRTGLQKIFIITHRDESKQEINYMRLTCKFCEARLNFKKKNNVFTMSAAVFQHDHSHLILSNQIQGKVFDYFRSVFKPKIRLRDLAERTAQKFSISRGQSMSFARKFRVQFSNSYCNVRENLIESKFDFLSDNDTTQKDIFPKILVLVSPIMKQNYQQYGDMVSFDMIFDNNIKNQTKDGLKFKLGIFCVQDTNMRQLLAGLVFICQQNQQTYENVFRFFFEIHRKLPQSIITKEQPAIQNALDNLILKKIFNGAHLLDLSSILKSINQNFLCQKRKKELLTKSFLEVTKAKSYVKFEQSLSLLFQNAGQNMEFFQHYLEKAHKICYYKMPKGFIGGSKIRNGQKIRELVKSLIPKKSSIAQLVMNLKQIDAYLKRKSQHRFECFKQSMDSVLNDDRVDYVRKRTEKKIFTEFLDNYLSAVRGLQISSKYQNPQKYSFLFNVSERYSSETFKIQDWVCECNQLTKTGIPCSHLIFAARALPNKSYLQLFNPRWKKKNRRIKGSQTSKEFKRTQQQDDNDQV